jgi:predicted peptidase
MKAICVVLALSACTPPIRFQPDEAHGFIARTHGERKYQVSLPEGWTREKAWPVILYLHGGGEVGTDGVLPTQVGVGPRVFAHRADVPYVVVYPQCPRGRFWAQRGVEQELLEILDEAMREYSGDPKRVILTGNSMGGYGTWIIGARYPERFAALVPICGGVRMPFGVTPPPGSYAAAENPEAALARDLRNRVPVWAFHGASDGFVSVDNTRRLVAAVRAAGGDVKYTEYPGVGHNSWDRAYAEPELWAWLAARSR